MDAYLGILFESQKRRRLHMVNDDAGTATYILIIVTSCNCLQWRQQHNNGFSPSSSSSYSLFICFSLTLMFVFSSLCCFVMLSRTERRRKGVRDIRYKIVQF